MKFDITRLYKKPTAKNSFKSSLINIKDRTFGFFKRGDETFKYLFIIENILLLILIVGMLIYEYYILDRSAVNLTTQNKLTATSIIINLLMSLF